MDARELHASHHALLVERLIEEADVVCDRAGQKLILYLFAVYARPREQRHVVGRRQITR
jgi:hypothetical protein